jgi:ABC-type nitrate/sulfonate/bicarbonate transport system permease component
MMLKKRSILLAIKKTFSQYYSVLLILFVWEVISRSGVIHPVLLPPVSKIVARFFELLFFGKLLYHTGQSMLRMWIGLGLAILVGVPLGITMARFAVVRSLMEPLLSLGFPIPKIGIYPVLIIFFGVLHFSKIALIFIEAAFPIIMATFNGALFVEQKLIWSAESMGTKKRKILWKVILPLTLHHIFMGFRVGLIVSLIVVFLSEMIASAEGLGHLMMSSSRVFKSADMFVAIGMISFLGLLFDRIFLSLRRKALKWHPEAALY